MYGAVVFPRRFGQAVEVATVVFCGKEGRLAVVAALDDVLWNARHVESRFACHISFLFLDRLSIMLWLRNLSKIDSDPFIWQLERVLRRYSKFLECS